MYRVVGLPCVRQIRVIANDQVGMETDHGPEVVAGRKQPTAVDPRMKPDRRKESNLVNRMNEHT